MLHPDVYKRQDYNCDDTYVLKAEIKGSHVICSVDDKVYFCLLYTSCFKEFNNCYILLSNFSQAIENTKFVTGEFALICS